MAGSPWPGPSSRKLDGRPAKSGDLQSVASGKTWNTWKSLGFREENDLEIMGFPWVFHVIPDLLRSFWSRKPGSSCFRGDAGYTLASPAAVGWTFDQVRLPVHSD